MTTLIGNGGHARDIAFTDRYARIDDHRDVKGPLVMGVIIGVNDPQLRAKIAAELGVHDLDWVHPEVWFGPDCDWGYGTHINYGVTMTRTTIGCHCTISPGVTICGDVVIGDRVMIGAGAVICNLVTIGDDATIGAGSVVLPGTEVRVRGTMVGNPARYVTKLTDVR